MKSKKGMVTLWVIVAIVIVAGILIYFNVGKKEVTGGSGSGLACDADVKTCPDGSFVSRNANKNCAFDDCPAGSGTGGTGSGSNSPRTFDVLIDNSGFSPSSLTIHSGDTVKWTNRKTSASWPASAVHPTHKIYPGSDIAKCGTSSASTIFDACRGLANGQSWSFTFTQVGSWNYHDHLNPSAWGTIVVQ